VEGREGRDARNAGRVDSNAIHSDRVEHQIFRVEPQGCIILRAQVD
jgi:hypothetical protein